MNKKNDNYIYRIILFFGVLIVAGLIFRHFYYAPKDNSERLALITPDNDFQGYHPKVVYFDKKWNGYKYWIAFTPYPNGNEEKENPVVNASNDLIKWYDPDGENIALDTPDVPDSKHYNSDTHLLYNSKEKCLELFWRYVNDEDNEVTIYKMKSYDGKNWEEKEVFLFSDNRKERDYVSPAIIYQDGVYKVWYVDKRKIFYLEKKDDNITEPKIVNTKYLENLYTWHLDVEYNKKKNIYELITVAYYDVNKRSNMDLFYSYSKDGLDFSSFKRILTHSTEDETWDSQGLYRSSLLYVDKYYIFYSGHDEDMNVGVGLMCGKNIDSLSSCTE